MVRLALRNLFQSRVRLVVSVGGVALALTLILALDAIFTGLRGQITAYMDNAGADVYVSQAGVRNLHLVASTLPADAADRTRAVPGVAEATPLLYMTNTLAIGDERYIAYLFGLPSGAAMGGPWRIAAGKARPDAGEVIIDRTVAEQAGVRVGDRVAILGRPFVIAGLAEGTANLMNSIAFITMDDFAQLRGTAGAISFVLVRVAPGEDPQAVARRIEAAVPGVTAQARRDFAAQERRVVNDMAGDLITIMNLVGFVIGLAVLALTVYTATLARRAEYGVLKALGAGNGYLYRTVLAQALLSVALGFLVGLGFTLLLAVGVPRLAPSLILQISGASLLKVGLASLVLAGLAAVLPIRQIAGLDPAMVFKGGGAK